MPHGAKSFLVAALAQGAGERVCWIARDAEIGDRVADELVAWLGDPDAVAVLEPRTALAYERSELIRDESAARVATLARWRSGRARVLVASVQALLQPTILAADLPAAPRALRRGDRVRQGDLLAELLRLGYEPVLEVAGRGEMARRGGLVDVFPAGAELPVRIELFGDEIDEIRVFDPTDQRTVRPADRVELLPATEFLVPARGPAEIGARLGALARRLPERLAADLDRLAGDGTDAAGSGAPAAALPPGARARATAAPTGARATAAPTGARATAAPTGARALDVGDAAEVWAAVLCPASGLDHVLPGALLVVDEPGEIAAAAEFLWEQAAERRRDLVAAGELPGGWPDAYLAPRDWKARLLGARTLELTWEPGPVEAIGGSPALDDAVRLARAGAAARPELGARPGDRALARRPARVACRSPRRRPTRSGRSCRRAPSPSRRAPGSARRPRRRGSCSPPTRRPAWRSCSATPASRSASPCAPACRRPAPWPSWAAASTPGSPAGRTAWSWSRTASCSARCASGGRRRCGGSSRATSSSA